MSHYPFEKNRQVVPRWHAFKDAVQLGELAIPKIGSPSITISPDLRSRLEQWRISPSIVSAAEAIETAIVEGLDYEGVDAAMAVLAPKSTATPLLQEQATLLLERSGKLQLAQNPNALTIAGARRATRNAPYDPFAWTDLARGFASIRKHKEAKRAMRVALQLAPYNRYVLRSAARLLLHLGDPEEAHDLLRRNAASRHDPWLMAAEIALSRLAERRPAFFKSGSNLIEAGNTLPRHQSELASAIGTVHLLDGNRKARRLFNTSLIDPTGNALAQAEWATPHLGGNIVRPGAIERVPDKAEAVVFDAYWKKDFEAIVEACESWRDEEPFSSRPFVFGAVAAITTEQYERAVDIAVRGLRLAPDLPLLTNNLAFAFISLGKLDQAAQLINSHLPRLSDADAAPMTATAGLLALRRGDREQGVQLYRKAVHMFRRMGSASGEGVALAYFARAAVRFELPEAVAVIDEAKEFLKKIPPVPDAEVVLERAEKWAAAIAHRRKLAASA